VPEKICSANVDIGAIYGLRIGQHNELDGLSVPVRVQRGPQANSASKVGSGHRSSMVMTA
jgi:hypothetical protein